MNAIPNDWLSLLALAFALGLKHGFDADHLATIDGLTRFNSHLGRSVARYCGTLFSLGHGAVVLVIALSVSSLAGHWEVPTWFDTLGSLISIAFLLALGGLNLRAVLVTPASAVVQPVGLKGRWLGGLRQVSNPFGMALIGALFALSFDTLSQAAFFALAATRFGGWQQALALALLFVLGMLLTDGLNGLWIARLIARADRTARRASRIMSLTVSLLSLLVGGWGLARMVSPGVDAWSEGKDLLLGCLSIVLVAAVFGVVMLRLRRVSGG